MEKFAEMETGESRQKYNSRRTELDGIVFDSCAEALAYQELKLQQAVGHIAELKLQPRYLLQEAFRDDKGKWHRAISYRGDFSFLRIRPDHMPDESICVDVKGVQTPVFRMKAKMFAKAYPHITLEIWDTRRKKANP